MNIGTVPSTNDVASSTRSRLGSPRPGRSRGASPQLGFQHCSYTVLQENFSWR